MGINSNSISDICVDWWLWRLRVDCVLCEYAKQSIIITFITVAVYGYSLECSELKTLLSLNSKRNSENSGSSLTMNTSIYVLYIAIISNVFGRSARHFWNSENFIQISFKFLLFIEFLSLQLRTCLTQEEEFNVCIPTSIWDAIIDTKCNGNFYPDRKNKYLKYCATFKLYIEMCVNC